jgi:hypothetical protein
VQLFRDGRIMSVSRYAFRATALRGLTCFTDPRTGDEMFVTDAVVAAAESAGLTGTRFRKLWQSPDA